jgi:polysaccharide pyruvyl transferase WcaK-like protein
MRLHSTLTALRFGVPGINLSYTLKGHNILANMGLGDHVVSIEDFLISPESVLEKTKNILNNYDYHQKKNNEAVAAAIQLNASVMKDIFN